MTNFLITLVIIMCSEHSNECRSELIPYEGSMFQCTVMGQIDVAQYMQYKPRWSVSKYRCTSEPYLLPENTI